LQHAGSFDQLNFHNVHTCSSSYRDDLVFKLQKWGSFTKYEGRLQSSWTGGSAPLLCLSA